MVAQYVTFTIANYGIMHFGKLILAAIFSYYAVDACMPSRLVLGVPSRDPHGAKTDVLTECVLTALIPRTIRSPISRPMQVVICPINSTSADQQSRLIRMAHSPLERTQKNWISTRFHLSHSDCYHRLTHAYMLCQHSEQSGSFRNGPPGLRRS